MAAVRQSRSAPARIRWDRVARWALIFVFALVVYLYIGPARAWISAYAEAKEKRTQVSELRAENEHLRERQATLKRASALEREARRLGMVKAGEKAFVVQGLRRGSPSREP
jgi:cell division protein FtsB